MKYNVVLLTEFIVWKPTIEDRGIDEANKGVQDNLGKFLGEGYELFKVIKLENESALAIKYILRQKITK